MLNDVLSLCVGLWAVKVANQKTSSKNFTYGWQRAETLGALVNGVFLVALCLSIFLEAIQRLVEPQEVRNPKLVLIVGCLGLFSNFVGLALFHDHSHGHGGHSHGGEIAEDSVESAEQGYATPQTESTNRLRDETGNIVSVLPENVVGQSLPSEHRADTRTPSARRSRGPEGHRRGSRRFSSSMSRFPDADSINIHPASLRQDIIKASRFEEDVSSESDIDAYGSGNGNSHVSERSGLLSHSDEAGNYSGANGNGNGTSKPRKMATGDLHDNHNHAQPKDSETKKGGHSHDLNMRGVFLHVLGDALGNIGVIISALVIWLTSYSWRYYVDPGISLLITVIILCSAIPLCKAASRILLQAVPAGLSIDHIIEDIESLPGVMSCHHLHVWQLSDTKLVASLHIQVGHDIKGEGSDHYMFLARQVRRCLHEYGIHSSTIQPEFYPESDSGDTAVPPANGDNQAGPSSSSKTSPSNSVRGESSSACLLECGEECAPGRQCCSGNK